MKFDNDLLHKFNKELDEDDKDAIMQDDYAEDENGYCDDDYDDYIWESDDD